MPKRTTDRPKLNPVNVGAAAIDIGSQMHMAAVDRFPLTRQYVRSAHCTPPLTAALFDGGERCRS
ncbi:hypothetical protein CI1B_32970 [Bradyrhizobium ivorense]|uniref:Uncharacterized protein n=1 Tax=Bradyrhizobium ivorense TaxID=2511166 RepID=A0A508T6U7_9BRAD|nr:hypothetical protein CI1B_32970 [Bradyrhizobium ivorense]